VSAKIFLIFVEGSCVLISFITGAAFWGFYPILFFGREKSGGNRSLITNVLELVILSDKP